MAAHALARGMGTFFKDCEHPASRWSKCPHEYKIRYRSAAGNQTEESGFGTQDGAIERLMEIYKEKKATSRSQSKAERIQKYGTMRFEEYVEEWKGGQRHLATSSVRHLESFLEHHLYPAVRSIGSGHGIGERVGGIEGEGRGLDDGNAQGSAAARHAIALSMY
ncbi:hypothetical protein AB5J72_44505 [Streptomyces sp. CG1]|uniref:hypothetical protein n=1 Tax=Streptomyces sp. CG1 TaxID=1287523 RepID=UPI0034E1F598